MSNGCKQVIHPSGQFHCELLVYANVKSMVGKDIMEFHQKSLDLFDFMLL